MSLQSKHLYLCVFLRHVKCLLRNRAFIIFTHWNKHKTGLSPRVRCSYPAYHEVLLQIRYYKVKLHFISKEILLKHNSLNFSCYLLKQTECMWSKQLYISHQTYYWSQITFLFMYYYNPYVLQVHEFLSLLATWSFRIMEC